MGLQKATTIPEIVLGKGALYLLLFCIVMNAFSYLFDKHIQNHEYEGIKSHWSMISHFLFADEVILFGAANANNLQQLNKIFSNFYMASNLSVNYTKSSLYFSKNVSNANELCSHINIFIQAHKFLCGSSDIYFQTTYYHISNYTSKGFWYLRQVESKDSIFCRILSACQVLYSEFN